MPARPGRQAIPSFPEENLAAMTDHIDEFESMFRRAERQPFDFVEIPIETVTLIGDQYRTDLDTVRQELQTFIPRLESTTTWRQIGADEYQSIDELLTLLDQRQTDLVVTWRHLREDGPVPQFSLGAYLDVLTQATTIPVLVLPGTAHVTRSVAGRDCNRVMVVTDHISGDNRLVNYGARFCSVGGTIWLTHIEDEQVYQRYMDAIERIPQIDTAEARDLIAAQLLKDAHDFIATCADVLRKEGPNIACHEIVQRGHHLRVLRELINEHGIDLVVTNTKDSGQQAMHGAAYSLSVEFVDVALLLL